MALQKKYTNPNTGIELETWYYKVRKECLLKGNFIVFSVDIFASIEARNQNKSNIWSEEYSIEIKEDIKFNEKERVWQVYTLLKMLPEFSDAIDC